MLRVVSWNVLADAYVRHEYYPRCQPSLFDRATRRKRIVERLTKYASAEVICLQEVDTALFGLAAEALTAAIGRHFKKLGRGEGCAMFVRRAVTDEPSFKELVFSDLSGHVALGVTFAGLSVVTTHLKWEPATTPPAEHRGVVQLSEILDTWPTGSRIVCGDFNATPTSDVVAIARSRGLVDAYASMNDAYTANSNEAKKRIDYIFHSPDLRATPSPVPPLTDETPLPSDTEPSDHLPIEAKIET